MQIEMPKLMSNRETLTLLAMFGIYSDDRYFAFPAQEARYRSIHIPNCHSDIEFPSNIFNINWIIFNAKVIY